MTTRALVHDGSPTGSWEGVDDPILTGPRDALVRIRATTLCHSDLSILAGRRPDVPAGRVLGHEAVATVVETGREVEHPRPGDRVLVPAITSCGRCAPCRAGRPGHCVAHGSTGWALGKDVDGVQAEYARIPYADRSLLVLPDEVDDATALLLADVLPSGYELGVRNGRVGPGDTVVVIGAGPVGLAAVTTSRLHGAAAVVAGCRSARQVGHALAVGADHAVDLSAADGPAALAAATGRRGADVAVEATGRPEALNACLDALSLGGTLASIGVHEAATTLPVAQLQARSLTAAFGLLSADSVPMLVDQARRGRLSTGRLTSHRFPLHRIQAAYDLIRSTHDHSVLKVVLEA